MARARGMVRSYAEDVRLVKSRSGVAACLLLLAAFILLPTMLDDIWANVFLIAGYTAIAALGLNLLTGYTGLPSLGTAGFIAIGAFTASYLGRPETYGGLEWDFWAYGLAALAIGALVGFIVGLPVLRLRGVYLSIATLALVFVTIYVLKSWDEVSGGNAGTPMPTELHFLGQNWLQLDIFGESFGRSQGLLYLVWAFVAITALLCKNIVRSRPGRALQAVRDRDVAAEVVGVSLFRSKVGAFVISSALATFAGVFYGFYIQYLDTKDSTFGLNGSIQLLAVIVVGGIGTNYGPIVGALVIAAIPQFTDWLSGLFPFLFTSSPSEVGFTQGNFQVLLYALLIIVFLITEPNGVAGLLRRFGGYFRSWPLAGGRRATT